MAHIVASATEQPPAVRGRLSGLAIAKTVRKFMLRVGGSARHLGDRPREALTRRVHVAEGVLDSILRLIESQMNVTPGGVTAPTQERARIPC